MNIKLIIFILFSALSFISLKSYAIIDYNDNCKNGFSNIIALNHAETEKYLKLERINNPKNSVVDYLEVYSLFLKYATTEKEVLINDFNDKLEVAVTKIKDEDMQEPFRLYMLADMYLESALINAIEGNYFSAVFLFKKSYSTINENIKLFPNFAPNNKTVGLLNVIIGSIPQSYNWALTLLNISGDIDKGLSNIETALKSSINNKEYKHLFVENLLLYTFMSDSYSKNKESNILLKNIINNEKIIYNNKNNLLFIFAKASYHQNMKENNEVIKSLQILHDKTVFVNSNFCYLNYMMGQSLLFKLNNRAIYYFESYIKNYKGKNYIASAKQKIAWSKLIVGDNAGYLKTKKRINTEEDEITDSDKQAIKEAKSNDIPNVYLLKARLYFDGGYYHKADSIITKGNKLNSYISERNKIEYIYRLGRINDEWGNNIKAEHYYKKTIDKAKDLKYFYAAKSALKLGNLYENEGDNDKALEMYNLILDLDFDEYQNGITQKAKAGINRINNHK